MLLRTVIFASFAALLVSQIPALLKFAQPGSPVGATGQQSALQTSPDARPQAASLPFGRVKLPGDSRGHFSGSFRINGKPVDGMIDTGASTVAINETTARRLGFGANSLDFRYTVNTANGGTEAARVVLDRVEIGGLRVRDVEALVLRDKALTGMLVGMSFLSKLKSYQVQDGNLTLSQ